MRRLTVRVMFLLLMGALAATLFGCAGPPQIVVVTATPPPAQPATPIAPPPVEVPAAPVQPRGLFQPGAGPFSPHLNPQPIPTWFNPDHYEPMPLPEVPFEGSNPPPGIYVNPNIPGNGPPPFPVVQYPFNYLGPVNVTNSHYYLPTEGGTIQLNDPGNLLEGWLSEPTLDLSGVVNSSGGVTLCRAVPYATVNPDGSPIQPRLYTKGDCEMG